MRRSGANIAAHERRRSFAGFPRLPRWPAVPVRDLKRGEEIKICVELRNDVTLGNGGWLLVDHARAHLAPFKVPRYIAIIPTLPRTTSNKKSSNESRST
ncbi:AMP-binding enzyme [Bradyrhizobium cajani]|nr:hypothetical protein [Bradyrhizobium cajani]MCP3368603.1 hypothetical protein [Bradyrhizobium cajani]